MLIILGLLALVALVVVGGIAWMAAGAKRAMNRNDNR